MILKYKIKADSITFWCSAVDENKEAAKLLNKFLFDISKERKVFFHGYRLPYEDALKIIDPSVILEKAQILSDPFNIFFYLSKAKVDVSSFDCACEAAIYFFESTVEWSDFLATSVINKPMELIKKGILSAYFATVDQGADIWFECNRTYEGKALQLFKRMSDLGYEVKSSVRLSFPYSN